MTPPARRKPSESKWWHWQQGHSYRLWRFLGEWVLPSFLTGLSASFGCHSFEYCPFSMFGSSLFTPSRLFQCFISNPHLSSASPRMYVLHSCTKSWRKRQIANSLHSTINAWWNDAWMTRCWQLEVEIRRTCIYFIGIARKRRDLQSIAFACSFRDVSRYRKEVH